MAADTTDALVSEILSDDIDGLSLHALLGDKEVKAAIIAEFRDTGVPAPGIAYRLLVFGIGGCERFLGGSIKSRLTAYIDRSPALARIFQNILNLRHGAKTQDELKSSLLNSFINGNAISDEISVDAASSIETIIALHTAKSLDELDSSIASLGDELVNSFRDDLKAQFNRLVRPNIGWHTEAVSPETLSSFDRLKYTSGIDDFVGRDQEIDLLHHFAGDPSFGGRVFNFRWMLMTGPGGEGKSRLAYHFTRNQLSPDWEKGKLDYSALKGFADPAIWRPNRPTFIVIDYAQSVPEDVHVLLGAFSRNASEYEFPVRLLLLERSSEESWTDKMLPETSSKPIILQHNFGKSGVEGTPISPLLPHAITALMRRRIEKAQLAAPEPQKLLELAFSVDPRRAAVKVDGQTRFIPMPRPLFALAAAEQVVVTIRAGEDLPNRLNQEDVFSGIIQRDRDTIWRKAVPNEGQCRRYEMGLAIATLAQGIELADLSEEVFGTVASWLPPAPPDHNEAHLAAFGFSDGHWPAMEPDILGEFFVSEQLLTKTLSQGQRNALIAGALTLDERLAVITLLRMARDFPKRLDLFDLPKLATMTEAEEVLVALSRLSIGLTGNSIATGLASLIFDEIIARKEKDYEHSQELALKLAKAAFNILNAARKVGDWGCVEEMLSRLDTLRAAFPQDQEIVLAEAKAAFNILNDAGEAGDWRRVDAMLSRLDTLRAAFPQDREIALVLAMAAVNTLVEAGKAGDWGRGEAMLSRLDTLRAAFPLDQAIALNLAMAAVNISITASKAGDWGRVEAILSRLDALRAAFPQDQEIALMEAQAAVNISNAAGKAGDWGRVEAILSRLDALRAAFPQDQEIALMEAQAAVNISNAAGQAGDWGRVEAMLSRLDVLIQSFGNLRVSGRDDTSYSLANLREYVSNLLKRR